MTGRSGSWEVAEDLLVILVVEDDPLIQILVEEQLTDGGFELAIATSGEEAVTLLKGRNTKQSFVNKLD
jgi:CheY-like chemotaxis protein